MIAPLARWIDRRVGGSAFVQTKLLKIFPESWTFLFGELALYTFIILVATGTYLALFFDASHAKVVYHGHYDALEGLEMSAAYRSVIRLSFDVRAGLFMRQVHHWAALIFVGAIVVHMSRVFFTGAFRRPRELNWVIGVTLVLLSLIEGFVGYSLPDDLLSGTGLRIAYSILESFPLIGLWLVSVIFGGLFPGEYIIPRLFTAHVFIVPAVLAALIGLHLALVFRQTHTQFPGPGRREDNVVGIKLWPTYTALSAGFFFLTSAVLAGLGGLIQINPVWFYGPYDPFVVTIGSQPDWYMGWLEGSLRLFPPWEFRGASYMIPNPFFPAALLPILTFAVLYAWPWIEARVTGDRGEHHILDRPRDRPVRSAIGAAFLTFYAMLTIAGATDIFGVELRVDIRAVVTFLQWATLILPAVVGLIVYRWCRDLAATWTPADEQQALEAQPEEAATAGGGS